MSAESSPGTSGDDAAARLQRVAVVEIGGQMPMRSNMLLAAYMRAVERFRAHVEGPNRRAIQVPPEDLGLAALCEALEWADTLMQHLANGPRDTRHKYVWPPHDDVQADLVRALKWARNRVHHQWWTAVAYHIVRSVPGSGATWLWDGLHTDAARRNERDAEGARAYEPR